MDKSELNFPARLKVLCNWPILNTIVRLYQMHQIETIMRPIDKSELNFPELCLSIANRNICNYKICIIPNFMMSTLGPVTNMLSYLN